MAREGSVPERASQPIADTSFDEHTSGPAPVTPILKGGWQAVPRRILQPDNELLEEDGLQNRPAPELGEDSPTPLLSKPRCLQPRTKANDVLGRDGSSPIDPASSAMPRKKAKLSPGPGLSEKNDNRSIRQLDTRNTALVDGI